MQVREPPGDQPIQSCNLHAAINPHTITYLPAGADFSDPDEVLRRKEYVVAKHAVALDRSDTVMSPECPKSGTN
jgi:hypothetical protein